MRQLTSLHLFFVLLTGSFFSLDAGFKFGSSDARISIKNPGAKLVVNSAISNFSGTLDLAEPYDQRLSGQSVTFVNGGIEREGARSNISGKFDPSTGDKISLEGSTHLRAQPGASFDNVAVSGSNNKIEGTPKFTSPIVLADNSAELKLSIQNKLNKNIQLNTGKLQLDDTLRIGDGVTFEGEGTVDVNSQTLEFPGRESTWTSTLKFESATDIVLNSRTSLSGTWYFGPDHGTSVLQGNGNVLDMSLGGTLWVQAGHGLELTDIVVKGLSDTNGTFLMVDENSSVSLSNATLQLSGNYTITQGNFYFYGVNSKVITGNYILTFDQNGTMSIDAITVEYDPLTTPDIQNVRPAADDGAHHISVNNGRLATFAVGSQASSELTLDDSTYTLIDNQFLSTTKKINFRGNSASNLTLDGGNYFIQLNRNKSGMIDIAANKHATLQNIVLKDFDPAHISLGSGATITFGSNVVIELAENATLNYTLTFEGDSLLNGKGNCCTLGDLTGFVVGGGKTLTLANLRVEGVKDTGGLKSFTMHSGGSKLICRDVDLYLEGTTTFTQGLVDIQGDLSLYGNGKTFAYTSTSQMTIKKNSTLYCDHGLTFSYDPNVALNDRLAFENSVSSLLHLNGATFYATHTGCSFTTGRIIVQDNVIMESEASNTAEAIKIGSSVQTDILTGAYLDLRGTIVYE